MRRGGPISKAERRVAVLIVAILFLSLAACATSLAPEQIRSLDAFDACDALDSFHEEARRQMALAMMRRLEPSTFQEAFAGLAIGRKVLEAQSSDRPWLLQLDRAQAEFLRKGGSTGLLSPFDVKDGRLVAADPLVVVGLRMVARLPAIQRCLEERFGYRFH